MISALPSGDSPITARTIKLPIMSRQAGATKARAQQNRTADPEQDDEIGRDREKAEDSLKGQKNMGVKPETQPAPIQLFFFHAS